METTALALWLNSTFAGVDESIAIAVHGLYKLRWIFTPFLNLVSVFGKGGVLLILASLVMIVFKKTRRYGTAMLLGLGIGALITNLCLKPLVLRPRPYTFTGSVYYEYWKLLGQHTESDFSFPSGHTTAAMAASMAVFLVGPRKKSWVAFFFAFAMGVSRIYLSVHYFTDVMGGVLCGAVGGVAGYFISVVIPAAYYEAADFTNRLPANLRPQKGRHEKK